MNDYFSVNLLLDIALSLIIMVLVANSVAFLLRLLNW